MVIKSLDKKFKIASSEYLYHLGSKIAQTSDPDIPRHVKKIIEKDVAIMEQFYDAVEEILAECQHIASHQQFELMVLERSVTCLQELNRVWFERLENYPDAKQSVLEIFIKYPNFKQLIKANNS